MLLDQVLPDYHARAQYQILIPCKRDVVWKTLMDMDLTSIRTLQLLMGLRSIPAWLMGKSKPQLKKHTLHDLSDSGMNVISEVKGSEIVLGIIGKFWQISANVRTDIPAERFVSFSENDLAKAAWNFFLTETKGITTVHTETRIFCREQKTRRKFRLYWTLIGPFSGLIRIALLRKLRSNTIRYEKKTRDTGYAKK